VNQIDGRLAINAIKRELLEQRRFKDALGNPRSLSANGSAKYPRLSGDNEQGVHLAILVRFTSDLRARAYRHWLTASPAEVSGATNPPASYHYWAVQVGLLPNGRDPWWLALWDLQALVAYEEQHPGTMELVEFARGSFWRADPAAVPGELQPITIDMQTLTMDQILESQVDERLEMAASLAAYKPGEIVTLKGTIIRHNKGNTNVLFPSRKGGVEWAVVDSVIPVDVQ